MSKSLSAPTGIPWGFSTFALPPPDKRSVSFGSKTTFEIPLEQNERLWRAPKKPQCYCKLPKDIYPINLAGSDETQLSDAPKKPRNPDIIERSTLQPLCGVLFA